MMTCVEVSRYLSFSVEFGWCGSSRVLFREPKNCRKSETSNKTLSFSPHPADIEHCQTMSNVGVAQKAAECISIDWHTHTHT